MKGRDRLGVAPARWITQTVLAVAAAAPVFQLLREADRLLTDPFFHLTARSPNESWMRHIADVIRADVVGPAFLAFILGFIPAMLIALPAALTVSAGLLVTSRILAPCRWRVTWAVSGWVVGFLAGPPALEWLRQTAPHLPDDAVTGALCATLLQYLLHKQGAFVRQAA